MPSIFCCSNITPYRSQILVHEHKFREFLSWGSHPKESSVEEASSTPTDGAFVIQVVRQVNYGPLESKRYFVKVASGEFVEVNEKWLIDANFEKLNAYVQMVKTNFDS